MNDLIPFKAVPESEPIDAYGNKKGYQSWQQTIRRVSLLKANELKSLYGAAIENLEQYGSVTLRELAIIKAFESMISSPNPAMLNLIMERDEGRVPQTQITASGNIGDWMEYAKEQGIAIEDVMQEAERLLQEYNEPPKVVEGEIVD